MHTDESLTRLESVTSLFGSIMRRFVREVCPAYDTYELPKETEQRIRRAARQAASEGTSVGASSLSSRIPNARRHKTFSLQTYKYHAFADYVASIRRFGTTDVYSTEKVCYLGKLYV